MGLRSVSYQALVPSDMRFGDRRVEVDLELNLAILMPVIEYVFYPHSLG
ncbi:hypothetical protein [Vulcanisaeta sp. EB80]|jgi:hypothetical protein|nr:hypothetical protein [Vulcanisaeta sp. EB80]